MQRPTDPQENVYVLSDWRPSQEDSDQNGNVLYFKPGYGWYSGYWQFACIGGTTHWTHLPLKPPAAEDPNAKRDKEFERWLLAFPLKGEDDKLVKSLVRVGWDAAWDRAHCR